MSEPIKVGDELAWRAGSGRWVIRPVKKITRTGRIRCGPWECNADLSVRGREMGDPTHLERVTPEIRAAVERQRLCVRLWETDWTRLPDDVLRAVAELVEGQQ